MYSTRHTAHRSVIVHMYCMGKYVYMRVNNKMKFYNLWQPLPQTYLTTVSNGKINVLVINSHKIKLNNNLLTE